MTEKTKEQVIREAKMEIIRLQLARLSMKHFVPHVNQNYKAEWFHTYIMSRLDAFERGEVNKIMISLPPQTGKEIADNERVMTKNGFKNHGDLVIGDYVFGLDGKPKRVLALSEKVLSTHRITFSDNTTIDCHENHEWVVYKKRGNELVKLETKQMIDDLTFQNGNKKSYMYSLPFFEPIEMEESDLHVHPYLLGFWLGDGDKKASRICKPKASLEKIINKISSLGYECSTPYKTSNDYDLWYTNVYGLVGLNKQIGVYDNKHIPEQYLLASKQQRLELLAGLLDSDGCCYEDIRYKNSQRVDFSNTNKGLVEAVRFICNSFGWNTYWSEVPPTLSTGGIQGKQINYRVHFSPTEPIPTVRLNIRGCAVKRKRKIEKIEPLGDKATMGRCIQVEDGIYLVGETFIPTHNSELSTRTFIPYAIGKNPRRKIAVVTYGQQLSNSFNRDIKANMMSKEYKNLFPDIVLGTRAGDMAMLENSMERMDIGRIVDGKLVRSDGFIKTTAVTAPLTGTPVDMLVIDDLYKDMEEAQSETVRQSRWDWWFSVANSRLHNDSQVLFLMTRWHEDDLAGKLLKTQGHEWEVIRMPSLKDNFQADYDPRQEGEALYPSRHSRERMLQIKKDNPTTFNALYQQDPKPPENLLVFGDWGELNDWKPQGTKFYGLDLGYTNDPTALTEIWVEKRSGQKPMIYLRELIYKTGLNNRTLMELFKAVGVKKNDIIVCDTNEPKTLNEFRENGYTIRKAIKGKDSIKAGIRKLKEFDVRFSKDSRNLLYERNNYVYVMSGGRITDVPTTINNHGIDSVRTAVYTMFYTGKRTGNSKKRGIRSA
jgi:hypothetical protein